MESKIEAEKFHCQQKSLVAKFIDCWALKTEPFSAALFNFSLFLSLSHYFYLCRFASLSISLSPKNTQINVANN